MASWSRGVVLADLVNATRDLQLGLLDLELESRDTCHNVTGEVGGSLGPDYMLPWQ